MWALCFTDVVLYLRVGCGGFILGFYRPYGHIDPNCLALMGFPVGLFRRGHKYPKCNSKLYLKIVWKNKLRLHVVSTFHCFHPDMPDMFPKLFPLEIPFSCFASSAQAPEEPPAPAPAPAKPRRSFAEQFGYGQRLRDSNRSRSRWVCGEVFGGPKTHPTNSCPIQTKEIASPLFDVHVLLRSLFVSIAECRGPVSEVSF